MTKVCVANVSHLRDDFPSIKPIKSPLTAKMLAKQYYKPAFTADDAFVLQEKYYRKM